MPAADDAFDGQRYDLIAGESDAGARLDVWLARRLPALSRSRAAALIRAGRTTVNGVVASKPSLLLRAGDNVRVAVPAPEPATISAQPLPLDIVYQDDWLAVVNKPAGMPTHPAPAYSGGTLVNALLYHLRDLSGIGGEQRPGIVHRLDKTTSGLLMIAKHDRAHRALAEQFRARQIVKEYTAFVRGAPRPACGEIRAPLGRHPRQRKKIAVRASGRPAHTGYEIERTWRHHSRLRLRLFTGRTHQLRVHLAAIGHPIVGDALYGYRAAPAERARWGNVLDSRSGVFLHARLLRAVHPATGELMSWEAPEPAEFQALAEAFEQRRG